LRLGRAGISGHEPAVSRAAWAAYLWECAPVTSGDGESGTATQDDDVAHHSLVGQPHAPDEGPVAEAEEIAARMKSEDQPLGTPGKPLDRRSPFLIGMVGAAGVAVTVGLVLMISAARDVLVLLGLALFIAIGLEPAVSWLVRHGLRRGLAVTAVCVGLIAAVIGFFAAAIPPLVSQTASFIQQAPQYLQQAQDSNSWIGQLNQRFGLQQRLTQMLNVDGATVFNGLLGASAAVLGALLSTLLVLVLTIYFLADMPRIRRSIYRLVPASRRPRVILIGDAIFAKVGGFVLGNVVISVIAGGATFVWLVIFGVPYPLLLALLVALLDIVPAVGSTIAGVVCSLVALTVSLPVALATGGFFIVYRFVEDYVLLPRIMGRAVEVPALVTMVAVTLGGFLLGVVGAVTAIPIAAAVLLIVNETLIPRLDRA
jgi:predicted PurR-regulated permease PerM